MDKKEIDNYKIAFIHGNDLEDGKIEYYGKIDEDLLHTKCLLDYANMNYPNATIFKQLNVRHQPEVVAYFLARMGIIVFLNTTKYTLEHFNKYGKLGLLLMPDSSSLTPLQVSSLKGFSKEIDDFDVMISYNITLNDGILNSETYRGCDNIKPSILINDFLSKNYYNSVRKISR